MLHAVGSVIARRPLGHIGCVGAEIRNHVISVGVRRKTAEAGEIIAVPGKSGRVDRGAVPAGDGQPLILRRVIRALEGNGILVARIVDPDHGAAVRRDVLLRKDPIGVVGILPRSLRLRRSRRVGGAGHMVGVRERIGTVQALQIVLHGVLGVGARGPLGVDRDALVLLAALGPVIRHGAGESEGLGAALVLIPAREDVAHLGGICGSGHRVSSCHRERFHHAAAHGIEGDEARVRRVGPLDGHGALDGLGGEGQPAVLPGELHLAALRHRAAAGSHGNGVGRRIVVELVGVAQLDNVIALGGVVKIASGVLVLVVGVGAVEVAGLHVHVVHVEQGRGQRGGADALHLHVQLRIVVVIGEIVDVLLRAGAPQRPLVFIQRGLIGQLVAGEELRLERDQKVHSDLHEQRAGGLGLLVLPLSPLQMVIEVAPHPRVDASLGGDADGVQLEGEQAHADLKFHARADARRAHHVKVEIVVRRDQINGAAGDVTAEELDGEGVALGGLVLEAHAQRDVQAGADHEVRADAVNQNVETVHRAFLGVDLLAEKLDPVLLGVLHHAGVFVRKAAAHGVHVNILAQEVLLVLHQLEDLLADVLHLSGGALAGHVLEGVLVVLFGGGAGGGGDANAGIGAEVQIGVELIVRDVGEDPRLFPDRAAAGVDAEQDLLLKNGLHLDDQLIARVELALDLHREAHRQLGPQTVAAVKMRQRSGVDLGLHLELVFVEQDPVPAGHERHVALLHRRAVGIGEGVGRKVHVQIIAQLPEAVGLDGQPGQILGGLLGEAALQRLTLHVGLHAPDLPGRQLGSLLLAGLIDVHRRADGGFLHRRIGDRILLRLLVKGNAGDLTVYGREAAFLPCVAAQRAGVEREEVAHVHGGLGIQPHGGILVIGELHHGLIDREDIAVGRVLVRVRAHGQHVGREEHVLRVRSLISIGIAADAGDLHVGDAAVVGGVQRAVLPQVGAQALVDGSGIAHGELLRAGVSKGAGLAHLLDLGGLAVLRQRGGEQAVQRGHVPNVPSWDKLQAAVQLQVVHLTLFGDDVQHAHRLGLEAVRHKARRGILRQLHAVGLALLRLEAHRAAVVHGEYNVGVARRQVHKGLDAALLIVLNAEGPAGDFARLDRHRHIVGDLLRDDPAHLRRRAAVVQLGVQGEVSRQSVLRAHGLGQRRVIVPAGEQAALEIGRGKSGELRILGIGLVLGERHALGAHAVAQSKGDLIVGRDRSAAATAAGGTAGAAAGGGAAARGGLLLRRSRPRRRGVHAHAGGGHARLGIPRVHRLVRPHAHGGGLSAGGVSGGVEVHAVAVEQALLPQLEHRVLRVASHRVQIGGLGSHVGPRLIPDAEGFKVAHEERRHLLARHRRVGRERAVPGAAGDAVLRGPLHVGRAVGPGLHVREARIPLIGGRVCARHAAQHRHEHAAGQRPIRLERGGRGAVEEPVGPGVQHRLIAPVPRLHVRERALLPTRRRGRLGLARRGPGSLLSVRQRVSGDEREDHAQDQQQTDDPFFHDASPPKIFLAPDRAGSTAPPCGDSLRRLFLSAHSYGKSISASPRKREAERPNGTDFRLKRHWPAPSPPRPRRRRHQGARRPPEKIRLLFRPFPV